MPKILVADPIGAEGIELLKTRAEVDVKTGMKPPELLAVIADYDGLAKHRTVIGEGAFIGSGSMLVAPVRIGLGAKTGAGSVVTHDVAAGATEHGRGFALMYDISGVPKDKFWIKCTFGPNNANILKA